MTKHLVVVISAHGFGHGAQTAPVIRALRRELPTLRLTLRTTLPSEFLRVQFEPPFDTSPVASDFGMIMHSALAVDREASLERYRQIHAQWNERVKAEAAALSDLRPDLVLSNVSYLALAAAASAGIPALGYSSLNWADIFSHYYAGLPQAQTIHRQMTDAYNSAEVFLKLTPHMPMTWMHHAQSVNPVATLGNNNQRELKNRLGIAETSRLIAVALGGIPTRFSLENWPRRDDYHWLVPQGWALERDDMTALDTLDMRFIDVMCSCDAIITKPGYGTFAESACNGVPTLFLPRDDWPETPPLVEWMMRNNRAQRVEQSTFERGEVHDLLETLLAQAAPPRPAATGAKEVAMRLAAMLC